jgi:hypothetical protein
VKGAAPRARGTGRPWGRPVRIAAAALAAVALAHAPAAASLDGYRASLDAAASALRAAALHGAQPPAIHVVPAPLGSAPRFSPSVDDWLQSGLIAVARETSAKRKPADLLSMASALQYLASEAGSRAATPPRSDPRAEASRILAGPDYRVSTTTPAPKQQPTLFEKFLDWIFGVLERLIGSLAGATMGRPIIGTIFAVAILALAAIIVGVVLYRVARRISFAPKAAPSLGEPLPVGYSAADCLASANAFAASGAYAKAIALLYRAALLLLDERGRVPFDPAMTAGEYRRIVMRRAATAADPFDRLARGFIHAAFSEQASQAADWDDAQSAYRTLAPTVASR